MTGTTELWHNPFLTKGTIMSQDILSSMGFTLVNTKDNKNEVNEDVSMDISVIKPDDHKHPQIVFKLPRHILSQLKWEISDRVKLMVKDGSIALVKASKNDSNTFAISSQGTSIANAKEQKRGGVVKVGWRNKICQSPEVLGTHSTQSKMLDKALIVKLPDSMFA